MNIDKKKGIVCFDLDGTLNSPTEEDKAQHIAPKMIEQIEQNGWDVCVITTSRSFHPLTIRLLADLGINIKDIRFNCPKDTPEFYLELAEKGGYQIGNVFSIDDDKKNTDALNTAGGNGIEYCGMIQAYDQLKKYNIV